MNESKQRKIGAILSYLIIILNLIISFGYTPILTKSLGQSEYGLYSMVASIISTLTILDFGFSSAIVVYSNKYRVKKETKKEHNLYGMFIIIYSIIGIISSLIGFIIYLNINNLFGATMNITELEIAKKLMLILTFNLAVTFPLSVFSSIVIAYERFVFAKIINILTIILQPITMLILLHFGFRSVALAIVITILNILSLLFNALYCKYNIKTKITFNKFDFKLLTKIFAFSFWIFLNTIIDKINWSLDSFLIGAISGSVAISVYAIASQINNIYISFSTALSNLLLPKVTKMVEKGATDEELTDVMIQTGRLQLMVVGLILSGFIVFGKEFIVLWLGNEYKDSYYIGIALMLPMIISLIQNSSISIVQAKNKHKFLPIVLIFTSILNIIISIPLIHLYNGLGAAIGTGVSLFIANIVIKNIYFQYKVHLNIVRFFKSIFNISFALIVEMVVALMIIKVFNIYFYSWSYLIIGIIIYVLCYMILSISFLNSYERSLIKVCFKKIRGRISYEK